MPKSLQNAAIYAFYRIFALFAAYAPFIRLSATIAARSLYFQRFALITAFNAILRRFALFAVLIFYNSDNLRYLRKNTVRACWFLFFIKLYRVFLLLSLNFAISR